MDHNGRQLSSIQSVLLAFSQWRPAARRLAPVSWDGQPYSALVNSRFPPVVKAARTVCGERQSHILACPIIHRAPATWDVHCSFWGPADATPPSVAVGLAWH